MQIATTLYGQRTLKTFICCPSCKKEHVKSITQALCLWIFLSIFLKQKYSHYSCPCGNNNFELTLSRSSEITFVKTRCTWLCYLPTISSSHYDMFERNANKVGNYLWNFEKRSNGSIQGPLRFQFHLKCILKHH